MTRPGRRSQYRDALAAFDRFCRSTHAGRGFAELADDEKDKVLGGLENGSVKLEGADGKAFFEQMLKDVQQGFFADPIYGGNRDMVRVENDRLSRRALRLSRLGRPPQRALIRFRRSASGRPEWTPKSAEAMARKLPKKDVVIVGLGWTGSILAQELTDAGLNVVAIERGPWRDTATDFPPNYAQDELRYRIRHELFLRPEQTTFTFRNKMDQTALPIRSWGSFMPPNGVGGGGVHWNAETWRFLPSRLRAEDASDPALRRRIPAGRHDDPGLGRHL